MQIEYSGRYKKLLVWAELKELLIDQINKEDDSTILEAIRTEIVGATTLVYQRLQELKREAEEANAYIDSENDKRFSAMEDEAEKIITYIDPAYIDAFSEEP